jgi:hypothetical protein
MLIKIKNKIIFNKYKYIYSPSSLWKAWTNILGIIYGVVLSMVLEHARTYARTHTHTLTHKQRKNLFWFR